MVNARSACILMILAGLALFWGAAAHAQQVGGLRGMVYDQDFDVPLGGVRVMIAETGQTVETTETGNYSFGQLEPGTYTVVFSRAGYMRQVRGEVLISPGQLTEINAMLSGDFVEMEEFVVRDVQLAAGTEAALLELRFESPALMDSISADLMSQAGAGDAASALRLVAGATVQDGKFAVIRGLPDRYVNSQLNGIRLPTADAEKRAVELDQFPSDAIESVQVSKTFTPDQQGDASGGAVNIVLKGVPDEWSLEFSAGTSYNLVGSNREDFLSYIDGGINRWGDDDSRAIQEENLGENWTGAVGAKRVETPEAYDWSVAGGGKHEFGNGIKIGGFGSFYYDRGFSYKAEGIDDQYWIDRPGEPLTPRYSQGSPRDGDFLTSLFDIQESTEELKWGGLGVLGIETERHQLTFSSLFTKIVEDKVTLAENTRGKEYYFPGYDVDDPTAPGNQQRGASPYLRTETLEYTERVTRTFQFSGRHRIPLPEFSWRDYLASKEPELDWSLSNSIAKLNEPDKRQFGTVWLPESFDPGFPPFRPPRTQDPVHIPFKPAANFTLGNLQRTFKDITEESDQVQVNLKLPFEQWSGDEGYLKFGVFDDETRREYNQQSFSNFNDNGAFFEGDFDDLWSEVFPEEDHPIFAGDIDVDYRGNQKIKAYYWMFDLPLNPYLNLIGGTRYEETDLSIINFPEDDVTWFPPGSVTLVQLNPGDADVFFSQKDVLPSIGFKLTPTDQWTFRGNFAETVARQTFRELTPIQQQEFLGGDVFIGNPELQMSALRNYDLRLDYAPYAGGLVSASYFLKKIEDPIENVQRVAGFTYTTPVNYPEGTLRGFEFEVRQKLGHFHEPLEGLSVGANATLIDSEVTLSEEEAAEFERNNINAPMPTRDMTNAPEHLYNFFMTYDMERLGLTDASLGVFYTIRGDTLVAGAGTNNGNLVPNVYETQFGTLNASFSKGFGEHIKLKLSAKNLLDPKIQTVYRSKYIDQDVVKTSYRKGREYSVSLSVEF